MASINEASIENAREITVSDEITITEHGDGNGVEYLMITTGNCSYKVFPQYGEYLTIEKRF